MKTGFIHIADMVLETYIAASMEEQMKGLMHVKPPCPNMAFPYNRPQINKFWMKDTPSPLDIVFCNDNMIVDICYGEPYSTKSIGKDIYSNLVLEFPYGTVKKFHLKIGDSVRWID